MESLTAAADGRIDRRAVLFRTLCVCVGTLLAILPLAHVTGLRNTLVGFIAGTAALHFRSALWKDNPTLLPWLAWLGFAALSILWSTVPLVSFRSFRTDLLYPFVLFLASFMLVRSPGGRLALTIGAGAGTLMSLATTIAATIAPIDPRADAPGPGVLGWLAWKAGDTVDLSTFVAFVTVPLFLILLTSRKALYRAAVAIWLVAFAALGIMSESRTLVVSRDRRRSDRFCDQRRGDLAFAHARTADDVSQRRAGYDRQGPAPGNLVCVSGACQATPVARRRIRARAAVQDLPSR